MSSPDPQRPATVATNEQARKSSSPLIWILLLIALIAVGWYFYNRSAGGGAVDDVAAPAPTSDAMTPAPDSSVEREPARSGAAKPKPSARMTPAPSRDASLIGQPIPEYPVEAVRAREEGTVIVTAEIDAQGNAGNVEISKRSGSRTLDRAATREVAGWKFKPALEAGKPVTSKVQVPVDYRLDAR